MRKRYTSQESMNYSTQLENRNINYDFDIGGAIKATLRIQINKTLISSSIAA